MTKKEILIMMLEMTREQYCKDGQKHTGIPEFVWKGSDEVIQNQVLRNVNDSVIDKAFTSLANNLRTTLNVAVAASMGSKSHPKTENFLQEMTALVDEHMDTDPKKAN